MEAFWLIRWRRFIVGLWRIYSRLTLVGGVFWTTLNITALYEVLYSKTKKQIIMEIEELLTDFAGLAVIAIGTVSLAEALLQAKIIGSGLPMIQGAFISMFAISFGAVLMRESSTEALKTLVKTFKEL